MAPQISCMCDTVRDLLEIVKDHDKTTTTTTTTHPHTHHLTPKAMWRER